MSQENVDLVLAYHAAYNANEIDAAVDLCAPNVRAFPDTSVFLEGHIRIGRDEFRVLLEESRLAWKSCGHDAEEVVDVGDGRVLVRGDWGGVGITSGAETYRSLSTIYTIRDGQIAKVEYFFDHARALEAAGLRA